MVEVRNHDLRISGRLKAGNIAQGTETITPVANTPTSVTISGLDLQGTGTITGLCTPVTSVPGTTVLETAVSSVSSSGMDLYIYRTNTTATKVGWFMIRQRT
jgi:hypothetical protein